MELTIDPKREYLAEATGIYVRAKVDNKWKSVDIAQLDKESLLRWLRSRDGDNPWAEDVVGILLGHGNLHG
jgi:hypothetical protein